ncbi:MULTISPECIES: FAD/NAD(P)-binding protein [unclassified Lysobacter]|uniref:FAD/NAD(P)-binding protein n=1 Tax=unclassified Lysobacter TaxID=2635362 RepID=UPI001BE696C8|nr:MULTISPECIES: FAD/NAD(P)-binding protein [unclassified Lysobacter]MBT2750213.1 FAD/NAD(P)-binding protein [Lysobacter sp. ISL-50]MBT2775216.1 FAD/NAD(P)-binding protein [Lysobacter sp. ISL-54]MBT2782589.1 FAD/NAD(P)-binding protein [Lysobacter sp. ISL-52]
MRITIVGAGFSGSALASELARQAGPGVELCLVGQPESYGRGVAYGEARPEHLLNVRASDLGATPDRPGGFADWLNLTDRARGSYLPRLLYGEYLHAQLQTAVAGSTAGFSQIRHEAIAVERASAGFRVHLADGSDFVSDRVVLALGALPPQPLAGVGPRLAIHPSYLGWPWQDGAIDAIAPDARLLIVGTGLTMADVVVTLQRRGHRGQIVALSRHGLLPRAHGEQPPETIALPPAVLHALDRHAPRELLRALRTLTPVIADWRSLVDALRPHLQTFWQGVATPQRASFLRHLRSYWEIARHRIAPQLHDELQALRESGQLQIRAGRLLRARRGDDAVEALIRERGGQRLHTERFDVLIRATGLDTDVERSTHPLIAHLRESGLVAADPLGLGLRSSAQFEVLDHKGVAVRGLYAIGPLLRAQWWEITAVPELRVAARDLAGRLLSNSAASRQAAERVAIA